MAIIIWIYSIILDIFNQTLHLPKWRVGGVVFNTNNIRLKDLKLVRLLLKEKKKQHKWNKWKIEFISNRSYPSSI